MSFLSFNKQDQSTEQNSKQCRQKWKSPTSPQPCSIHTDSLGSNAGSFIIWTICDASSHS